LGSSQLQKNLSNGEIEAIKFELDDPSSKGGLMQEVRALQSLQDCPNVCRARSYGKYENWKYMVMPLFAENLVELQEIHGKFSIAVVLQIGLKALACLEQIHLKGFVHRDIKPSNFVVGKQKEDRSVLYIIDFGIAKNIVGDNGEIKKTEGGGFRGTNQFASLNSHMGRALGRHDDLWSLWYMLCDFMDLLPWKGLDDRNKIGEAKKKFNSVDTIAQLPRELLLFRNHLKDLLIEDIPNYGYVKKLMQGALTNAGADENTPFPWKDTVPSAKFSSPKPGLFSPQPQKGSVPLAMKPAVIKVQSKSGSASTESQESGVPQSKWIGNFAAVAGTVVQEGEDNNNSDSDKGQKSEVKLSNEIDFGPDTEASLSFEEESKTTRGNDPAGSKPPIHDTEQPEEDKKCCTIF